MFVGITIHYDLIGKEVVVSDAIKKTSHVAEKLGYTVRKKEEPITVYYSVVPVSFNLLANARRKFEEGWGGYLDKELTKVPDTPPWAWISKSDADTYLCGQPDWLWRELADRRDIQGREVARKGIQIENGYCTFRLAFYNLGEHFICNDFTKTQIMSKKAVKTNLLFHDFICKWLKKLQTDYRWFGFFVGDEGQYFDSWDIKQLARNHLENATFIDVEGRKLIKSLERESSRLDLSKF